jgi:thioredoxin-like negative regulator of GroEL
MIFPYRRIYSGIFSALVLAGCAGDIGVGPKYIPRPGVVTEMDKTNFSVLTGVEGKISMIEFYRPSCPPCRIMDSTVAHIAVRFKGKALVGRVNDEVDDTLQYAYDATITPTFIYFNGGRESRRLVGTRTEDTLAAILDSLLGSPNSSTAKRGLQHGPQPSKSIPARFPGISSR